MMASRSLTAAADDAGPRAELADPAATIRFMLAGKAHLTFQSRDTGMRFTYRIELAEERPGYTRTCHFVSVLTGPDNSASYEYLGCIFDRRLYSHGQKSRIAMDAPSAVAFAWTWRTLSGGRMHPALAVYHEGRCGRCGRRLTTPQSIETGLGPVCAEKQS